MARLTKRPQSAYRIEDPAALATIVVQLVNELGAGSETKAVAAIGLSQTTLNRLRRQRYAAISFKTAAKLQAAARQVGGNALADRVGEAIVSRVVIDMLREGYDAWCAERRHRFVGLQVPTWGADQAGRLTSQNNALAEWWRTYIEAMIRKEALNDFRHLFLAFQKWMERKRVDPPRMEVALIRILEPLAESILSAYVERRWTELSKEERYDFLKAGITREKILLNRPESIRRARAIAAEGVRNEPKP